MNLKKLGRTFWAIAAVAIMAMVLQGCGGDDGVSPTTHETLQQERDRLAKQVEDLMAALPEGTELTPTTLMALAGRADITQGDYDALIMALGDMQLTPATLMALAGRADITQGDYDALTMALGTMELTPTTLTMLAGRADISQADYTALVNALGSMPLTPATLMELAGRANITQAAYSALVTALGDMTLDVTTLEKLVQAYNENKETMNEEQAAAARATAEALRMEIGMVDLLDQNEATPAGAPVPTVSASSAGMFSASTGTYKKSDEYPDMIEGFRGAMLTKGRQAIVVYSDIEDATAKAINTLYNPAPGGAYYVDRTGTVDDDMAGDIPWSRVTRTSTTHTEKAGDTTATPAVNPMRSFPGMVGNVDGTFSCSAATITECVVPPGDAKGKVTDATNINNWIFTPTNAAAMVDVADADGHLVFGWWLSKNAQGMPIGVDVFADAMGLMAQDNTDTGTTLQGTATYTGGAAGKYALHHTGGADSEAGHFTATATLDADFDVSTDAADVNANENGIMISGTINGFMTGETARPDWTVTLAIDGNGDTAGNPGLADLASETVNAATGITRTATWDIGGGPKATGAWEAEFWTVMGTDSRATTDQHPTAVTGEFEAGIDDVAHIVGAFGATLDE